MRALLLLFVLTLTARAADPVEFTVGSFPFDRPEGWSWIVPNSPMRKAQLAFSSEAGPAEITFFHFGAGQGGTVQANVNRWFAQFSNGTTDSKTETVGKTQVTFVQALGTFASGMPGGPTTPMENYALRGAILQSPQGDVYVKMTGPHETVKSAEAAFEKMVKSAASR